MTWVKGQSGNPLGRNLERVKITNAFLKTLEEDWRAHGPAAMAKARETDPMGYVNMVSKLLPKEMKVEMGETFALFLKRIEELARNPDAGAEPVAEVPAEPAAVRH